MKAYYSLVNAQSARDVESYTHHSHFFRISFVQNCGFEISCQAKPSLAKEYRRTYPAQSFVQRPLPFETLESIDFPKAV